MTSLRQISAQRSPAWRGVKATGEHPFPRRALCAGALLFVGDGHAAQGDGELTGDALETSTEWAFTIDVLRNRNIASPRFENAEYFMASGISNSLPEALQSATTNLSTWLQEEYKLNPAEIGVVLGTGMRYEVAEVVDPQVHIVAKIAKSMLAPIPK